MNLPRGGKNIHLATVITCFLRRAATLRYIKGPVCLFHMDLVTFPAHAPAAFAQIASSLRNAAFKDAADGQKKSLFMRGNVVTCII